MDNTDTRACLYVMRTGCYYCDDVSVHVMTYSKRISIALLVSALAHAAVLVLWPPAEETAGIPESEPPRMIVQLREEPLHYIETSTPADEPPEEARHISTQDARATGAAEEADPEITAPGPDDALLDDMDIAPRMPPETPAPAAIPEPPPEPQPRPEEKVEPEPSRQEDVRDTGRFEVARAQPAPPPAPEPAPPPDTRSQPPQVTPDDRPPQQARSRVRGRSVAHGVTNFEALRHEVAPYLDHVKKKVERQWIEMLLMRYSGTMPARAKVFCAIAPDGSLVEARIVDMPEDPLFAGLCRDAVSRAAPFEPFPFEVPDIYQNRNLEITWHFNFL